MLLLLEKLGQPVLLDEGVVGSDFFVRQDGIHRRVQSLCDFIARELRALPTHFEVVIFHATRDHAARGMFAGKVGAGAPRAAGIPARVKRWAQPAIQSAAGDGRILFTHAKSFLSLM